MRTERGRVIACITYMYCSFVSRYTLTTCRAGSRSPVGMCWRKNGSMSKRCAHTSGEGRQMLAGGSGEFVCHSVCVCVTVCV